MKSILIVILFFLSTSIFSQKIEGEIIGIENEKTEKIFGATIRSKTNQVNTDLDGGFFWTLENRIGDTVVVSAPNYLSDTIVFSELRKFYRVYLHKVKGLANVVVTAEKESYSVSSFNPLHTEMIDHKELRKAACCNLSESFETNASVDVNITDAVSGAKKIHMMGVDGVYTQIQMEGIPYFKGVESSSGIGSMPGTWIESMQVTKGSGSIIYGYEPMVGLINLELKKPNKIERAFFNTYINRFGRYEFNFNGGTKVNDKWSQASFFHYSGLSQENDNNNDSFRDLPLTQSFALLNRWKYEGEKMVAQIGVNAYSNDIKGGQVSAFKNDKSRYGVFLNSNHVDLFAKTGFFFKEKPFQSIGILYDFKYQDYSGSFGNDVFNTSEKRGYINAVYDGIIYNTNHNIKYGTSIVMIDLKQSLLKNNNNFEDNRLEIVPGVFGEYTFRGNRFTSILGSRIDFHNLYGAQFSPRFHGKYDITETFTFRFSSGSGFRVPNFISDNVSLLANSFYWENNAVVQPEKSWNNGISFVKDFSFFNRKSQLVIDYYRTDFQEQLIVDRDLKENTIIFNNLEGKSYSNAIQVEFSIEPIRNFKIRMAYKYLDVKAEFGGVEQSKVMLPKNRGFLNLGYISRDKRWEIYLTSSVIGQVRLPNHTILEKKSESFSLTNFQVTHIYKKWDIYLGCENVFNYTQVDPIVDGINPFGSNFDATRVWGPIMGTNVYLGIRYLIKKKTEK